MVSCREIGDEKEKKTSDAYCKLHKLKKQVISNAIKKGERNRKRNNTVPIR